MERLGIKHFEGSPVVHVRSRYEPGEIPPARVFIDGQYAGEMQPYDDFLSKAVNPGSHVKIVARKVGGGKSSLIYTSEETSSVVPGDIHKE